MELLGMSKGEKRGIKSGDEQLKGRRRKLPGGREQPHR